jgi:hypothetical protein
MMPFQAMRLRAAGGGGGGGTPSPNFDVVTWVGAGAASKTITSKDLSNGGMVWVKRTDSTGDHKVYFKRASGTSVYQYVNQTTVAPSVSTATLDSTGFTVPDDISGATYVAWVFKKAANFFDIVDYTGTGSNTTVSHSLGEAPPMVVVGRYTGSSSKVVLHTGPGAGKRGVLNNNAAFSNDTSYWNSTDPTASVFSVGNNANTNANTVTYFAFLFANNTEMATGSYTGTSSALNLSLGFQPRFLVIKQHDTSQNWLAFDQTRSPGFTGNDAYLALNLTNAQVNTTDNLSLISGGVSIANGSFVNTLGDGFIYLAVA